METKVNIIETVNRGKLYEYIEIGKINGQMINLVQVSNRTLDYHVHEGSDELFYLLEGSFTLDVADRHINMVAGDAFIVPKGTKHRPVVDDLIKLMLIDMDGALNDSNCGGTYSK